MEDVAELLADAQSLMTAIDLRLADHSKHYDVLKTIQWALIEGKQVSGEYKTPYQPEAVTLTLSPIRLCLTGQAWYLIASSGKGVTPKTYRVARFQKVPALVGHADVPKDFNVREFLGNAWTVYRGDRSYDVELEFSPAAAEVVVETKWHHTQRVESIKDGGVRLLFTVDGLDEIVWWVLGWSSRVRVIDRPELRELVLERLQRAIDLNKGD